MKSREVAQAGGLKLWIAALDPGDEAKSALTKFARDMRIESASFVALGAFERLTVGYLDWEKKEYQPIAVDQQVEVLSFIGDVVKDEDGAPSLHAHTVVGLSDGTARGGHFLKGIVRPTLEVTFTQTPAHLTRRKRAGLNIPLIDIN
ncbi:MAG: PPC domain-containing DNA-binding protein [Rhizomicrobium sp.]